MSNRHLQHPDVQKPWVDWSEGETLHLAVAYSNPFRYKTRRRLMNDFRRHISQFPNVKLYVGELAYGDRPFEVTGLDDRHPCEVQQRIHHHNDLQFRSDQELWHKENLLNLIVSRFPPCWKYGGYCDADFTFTRQDWALEAIHLLQHYDFVQLFSSYMDLDAHNMPYRFTKSFAKSYLDGEFDGVGEYHNLPSRSKIRSAKATGGAWAFRRSAFDTVGGFLDVSILGSADWHMALGLVGGCDLDVNASRYGAGLAAAIHEWQNRALRLHGNIGCLDHHVLHHFHGSKKNRGYGTRDAILKHFKYEPTQDICRDWQGLYRWTGNKPAFAAAVRKYFQSRDEDDPTLTDARSIKC